MSKQSAKHQQSAITSSTTKAALILKNTTEIKMTDNNNVSNLPSQVDQMHLGDDQNNEQSEDDDMSYDDSDEDSDDYSDEDDSADEEEYEMMQNLMTSIKEEREKNKQLTGAMLKIQEERQQLQQQKQQNQEQQKNQQHQQHQHMLNRILSLSTPEQQRQQQQGAANNPGIPLPASLGGDPNAANAGNNQNTSS